MPVSKNSNLFLKVSEPQPIPQKKERLEAISHRLRALLRSKQGKNLLVFLIFVVISTVLWCVLTLNEEEQYDLRMPVRLANVPDSVTVISDVPGFINISFRSKGTQVIKYQLGNSPEIVIDYNRYKRKNAIFLTEGELKALIRNTVTASTLTYISPDSINILYTTRPGVKLPVELDCQANPGPKATFTGKPKIAPDSVEVFSLNKLPHNLTSISTEALRLTDIDKDTSIKAKLIAPKGCRVLPDSVTVIFTVEPLIIKRREIIIQTVNVPTGMKLITFPAKAEVVYMVPMSAYSKTDPNFRVTADYCTIDFNSPSHKVKLSLHGVPRVLENVYLSSDSAEYIIEK